MCAHKVTRDFMSRKVKSEKKQTKMLPSGRVYSKLYTTKSNYV